MRYHILATDFDGTLAHDGRIDPPTVEALKRLKETGRRLIMVTGRELEHLLAICPEVNLFESIVAENGAVLYNPTDKSIRTLADPPPPEFAADLLARGATGLSVGHVIVATWEPHQTTALEVIQDHGLELQVIFNKGAVMVLPSGVNKASGLQAALTELKVSAHNVVGVGDAENDHAFLAMCECAVAVSNALPALSERCDWTTTQARGQGVTELIEQLIENDLQFLEERLQRHHIVIGETAAEQVVDFKAYGVNLMICGTSGSGKSTLAVALLEQFFDKGYQFAIMDPEGDYEGLEFSVNLGTPKTHPTPEEVLSVLDSVSDNVSVNMLGIGLDDRPTYFNDLLLRLQKMRSHAARPHWVIVDEAHHMLPVAWEHAHDTIPGKPGGMIYITVHPQSVSKAVLDTIDVVIAVGEEPAKTVSEFCQAVGTTCPEVPPIDKLQKDEVIVWFRGEERSLLVHSRQSRTEHKRHWRKYAEGNLTPERSFYFRGPADKLNLRANNLMIFLQMADGVDDDTWNYHLERGDFSNWFGEAVRDEDLAKEAAAIEMQKLSAAESRAAIREIIERRYTKPAEAEVKL